MPTASTKWDIRSLIEHFAGIQVVGESFVHGVKEFHSNCPWCPGSHDSFVTRPETGQFSHAIRSGGCDRSGDGIDFLMWYVNMTRQEAVEELGLEHTLFGSEDGNRRHENSDATKPPKQWIESAELFVGLAEKHLWTQKGRDALDYLRGRGLSDETIKKAHLGYVPLRQDGKWYINSFEDWGLDPETLTETQRAKGGVRIPNGILIPWFVNGKPWKLAVKRPGEKMDYGQVMGSREPLYNVDALQYGEICMMVEGEFDCLAVMQEAGDLVNPVATGSKDKGHSSKWIAELSLASFILQSFDEDPADPKTGEKAGDKGAQFWLDAFEPQKNIERWSPMLWKDPNDLLKAQLRGETEGLTLRDWVQMGVDLVIHDMPIQKWFTPLAMTPLAREVQEELEIAPLSDIQSDPVEPEPAAREETQDDHLLYFADTVSKIVDVLGGPDQVKLTKHDGRTLEQTLRANAIYKPVTLPALPRLKCPHLLITERRVSDEMSKPVSGGLCKEKPGINGWCEYHQPSYELLQLGAKLQYQEMDLTISVINRGKRENIGRWILDGVENWEAYAEMTSPAKVKQDIARIKARCGL